MVTRFFLGFLESTIGPGLTVIVAMWYSMYTAMRPGQHSADVYHFREIRATLTHGSLVHGERHCRFRRRHRVLRNRPHPEHRALEGMYSSSAKSFSCTR